MNERIRELVRQTVESVDIVTGNESLDDELAKMYIPDCFSEKFAELIVRECAQVSEDDITDGDACCTNTAYRISRQIKKHFGVE